MSTLGNSLSPMSHTLSQELIFSTPTPGRHEKNKVGWCNNIPLYSTGSHHLCNHCPSLGRHLKLRQSVQPASCQVPRHHGIEHFITTTGPPVHAKACRLPLTSSKLQKPNSAEWKRWKSSDYRQVHRHLHSTWSPKHLAVGDHAETTEDTTTRRYLTDTQFHTSRIFPLALLGQLSSQRLTLLEAITKSQSLTSTSPEQP